MAAFDRRLLRRGREARTALVADSVLGVVAALLVLAQAVLLADVAARSFDGASLREVVLPLALLSAVVCARATTAWGFFLFSYRSGSVRDHDHEVLSAEWVPLAEAPKLLSYRGEKEVAAAAQSRVGAAR